MNAAKVPQPISTHGSKSSTSLPPRKQLTVNQQYMLILKCSMFVCIVMVAAGIGYTAYKVVRDSEESQFEHAYADLVKQLLPATNTGILKTADAVSNAVNVIGGLFPNSTAWPAVAYTGFTNMATLTSALSGSVCLIFTPVVYPNQVSEFEDFAYQYYSEHPDLYAANVGISSFGKGIYSIDLTLQNGDYRFHDTSGNTTWPSANRFLTPVLQLDGPGYTRPELNTLNMLNLRAAEETISEGEDRGVECAMTRKHVNESCSVVTGLYKMKATYNTNPHSFIIQPIISEFPEQRVVGYVSGSILFNDIIKDKIPVGTDGIDYVIQAGDLSLSFKIINGAPVYQGTGDQHNPRYNNFVRSVRLVEGLLNRNDPDASISSYGQSEYTISFYPSQQYKTSFDTPLRWVFCFGSVTIIMLVSVIFVTYDYFMVRENTEQQAVLDTKRQFVRFISHEVRTPLNAVAMAGDLMREQLLDVIKEIRSNEREAAVRRSKSSSSTDLHESAMNHTLEDSLELCEEIIGNTKNAVEVLDDLLNYDKIEVGGLSLDLSFVAMEHILENVLKPFKGPAKQKDVVMAIQNEQFLRSAVFQHSSLYGGHFCALRVIGDKVRLEQVIRNLISNALKFTSPMGKVTVTLEWVESSSTEHILPPQQVKKFLRPPSPRFSPRSPRRRSSASSSSKSYDSADIEMGQRSITPGSSPHEHDDSPLIADAPDALHISKEKEAFDRLTVIKSSLTRTPKDAHNSRHWGALRLSVTDDGAGMSPEQLRAVCSEGVQFNANELQAGQGSGLGLFIAKGIVKQHGGLMTVKSDGLRKGSTFIVELPVYACDVFFPWENRILNQAKHEPESFEKFGVYRSGVIRVPSMYGAFANERTESPTKEATSSLAKDVLSGACEEGPVAEGTETLKSPSTVPALHVRTTEKKKGRRVLVVDDVASNRKMVIRLLQRSGVEACEQAGDGQEAVNTFIAERQALYEEATREFLVSQETDQTVKLNGQLHLNPPKLGDFLPFDAVLMDFEMPVLNGPGATKKLRELGCTVPIVGISGNVLPADVQLFIDHGANAVLPKPLNFAELERIWNEHESI